ncbi:alpha/beta fold hydrolase [Xanthobacteraceae bacterium A53D]
MSRLRSFRVIAFAAVAVLALSAGGNTYLGTRAERENPPIGTFLEQSGVKLHYVDVGEGEPIVLLHGNGAMIEDFKSSGLMDMVARRYRVIAFDRPGFGHSTRPDGEAWTPGAQARLFTAALGKLGVKKAVIVGHSWGALVAATMALQAPGTVSGLVLAAGYFYPDQRVDVHIAGLLATPGLNEAVSYAVTPSLSRLLWPQVMSKVFGPDDVPGKFAGFSREMALRPWQLEAATEEAGMLPEATAHTAPLYGDLTMPVSIVVGTGDRLVDPRQSIRLHEDIPHSNLRVVPHAGHMVQQTATYELMGAIDEVSYFARQRALDTAEPVAH